MELTGKGNLAKAVVAVMKEVKGIEKNSTIGTGNNQYKGVKDQDVKNQIGDLMSKHGLCILPIEIEPTVKIDRWEQPGYNGGSPQQKQQVFAEVRTKYLLLHESGESVELMGYGHGIDTQDKSAGKATTYALKYTLLYAFLVPTGKIDDTDDTHSNEHGTPTNKTKPNLTENMPAFERAKEAISTGQKTIDDIKKVYEVSIEIEAKLLGLKK